MHVGGYSYGNWNIVIYIYIYYKYKYKIRFTKYIYKIRNNHQINIFAYNYFLLCHTSHGHNTNIYTKICYFKIFCFGYDTYFGYTSSIRTYVFIISSMHFSWHFLAFISWHSSMGPNVNKTQTLKHEEKTLIQMLTKFLQNFAFNCGFGLFKNIEFQSFVRAALISAFNSNYFFNVIHLDSF